MDRLPYELLWRIFSSLSNEDIINLPYSISCNGLSEADVASRFRHEVPDICIDEAGLRSLLRIGRHPIVGPTTEVLNFALDSTSLTYVSAWKYERHCKEDHINAERAWTEQSEEKKLAEQHLPGRNDAIHAPLFIKDGDIMVPKWRCCNEKALEGKYAHYNRICESQRRYIDEEGDIRLLSKAMKLLPFVTDIVIGGDSWNPNRTDNAKILLGDAWCSGCVPDPVDFEAHLLKVVLKSLAESGLEIRRFLIEDNDLDLDLAELSATVPRAVYPTTFEHLVVLCLNSIYYSPEHITKYQRWRRGDRDTNSDHLDSMYEESTYDGEYPWRRTMRLQDDQMMDGGVETSNLALTVDGLTKALAAMLSSCPLVEDLTVSCSDGHKRNGCRQHLPHLPLLKMFGCNRLSKLRKLEIANFRLEEDQLVGTLLLCTSTLEHLQISDVVLDRGTWESAMDRLRGQLRLASAEIGNPWRIYGMGPEMIASVKSYGLRKSRFAFDCHWGYYPYRLHVSNREARDWLGGKTLVVNPVWQSMRECAAKEAPAEDYSDSDEFYDSDGIFWE